MEAFSRQQASDPTPDSTVTDLKVAIIKGMKNAAGDICRRMLDNTAPLDVVEGYIIPALENQVSALTSQFTFGGTSLLIIVGVVLETFRGLEAQLTMRNYKGFL
jgi:preprotein translocase subunit SecY